MFVVKRHKSKEKPQKIEVFLHLVNFYVYRVFLRIKTAF